jgi:hypothetical protein
VKTVPSRLSLAILAAFALLAIPASAKITIYGSLLKADATITEAHPVDNAFWLTKLSGGRRVRAPATGQIVAVRVKGTVRRKAGAPNPDNTTFFQHLRPRAGGQMRVLQTSQPFHLTIGGDPNHISRFSPTNLCVRKGDVIDLSNVGGFTGDYPQGSPFQIFAGVPGSETARHTGKNALNNGAIFGPTKLRTDTELLMQLWLGTGANYGGACRGFNASN